MGVYQPVNCAMKSPHFAVKASTPFLVGGHITLTNDEAHHLKHVLRLKIGDLTNLINANGSKARAKIINIGSDSVTLEILENSTIKDDRLPIELIAAVIKGDKMSWLVQKAAELGVMAIRPVLTEHTVVRLNDEERKKKTRRWREIALQTLKQCKGLTIPEIYPAVTLKEAIIAPCNEADSKTRILLDEKYKAKGLIEVWEGLNRPVAGITILIGPEGGLSEDETDMCKKAGFVQASLGQRILKAETAAIAAISILSALILHERTKD
ncbi:MAG: 16S rRNA (uracil(1498)-N(3))-methyltransferase [Dissulfurimicrobium sp.]|uniref:16S rRNA (uracil(1498)-N(3))-methyltransferase n=1 Tax=Dissulfurimicrobium sp. TaxID=2022436 RepID=UPI0040499600